MCNLLRKIPGKSRDGFKAVAVSASGERFSLSMGFSYDKGLDEKRRKRIPVIRLQKRLSRFFNQDILTCVFTSKKEMEGRTAIFANKEQALKLCTKAQQTIVKGFTAAVFKAQVSEGLMEGSYNSAKVFAGQMLKLRGLNIASS